jgi:tRNA (guanine10-N2)-methyltransferase
MTLRYLIVFAQTHNEFRIPELRSVAELHGFTFSLPLTLDDQGPSKPFMVLDMENEEHARILAKRCILVKSVNLRLRL